MKKTFFTFFTVILSLLIVSSGNVFAQDKNKELRQKNAAKSFIIGTVTVIKAANTAKKNLMLKKKKDEDEGEAYIGKSIDYQKKAVELYKQNKFEKAIYHSMKARKLSWFAVKEFRGQENEEQWSVKETLFKDFDKEEKFYKKTVAPAMKLKKIELGDLEGELESGVDVSTTDPDPKDTKLWQELDKVLKVQ